MEIEIKVKISDRKDIRKKLLGLGAKPKGKTHQIDTYYSLYKRPYSKKRGSILRLRQDSKERNVILALHTDRQISAVDECEVEVGDLKTMQEMLRLIKAKKEVVVEKKREYFKKGNFLITLDKVKGLGNFMEVELQADDYKTSIDRIKNFYKKLGLNANLYTKSPGYNKQLLAKKNKKYSCF